MSVSKERRYPLFSPHVYGLYDAFGTEEFDEMYEKYEGNRVKKK